MLEPQYLCLPLSSSSCLVLWQEGAIRAESSWVLGIHPRNMVVAVLPWSDIISSTHITTGNVLQYLYLPIDLLSDTLLGSTASGCVVVLGFEYRLSLPLSADFVATYMPAVASHSPSMRVGQILPWWFISPSFLLV